MLDKNQSRSDLSLSISGAPRALQKLFGNEGASNLRVFANALVKHNRIHNVEELTNSLPPLPEDSKIKDSQSSNAIENRLRELSKTPGAIDDLAIKFAEAVYLAGGARPVKVSEDTYQILMELGESLVNLRDTARSKQAPQSSSLLTSLRELDSKLVKHAMLSKTLKAPDYIALNDQHRIITLAIKAQEESILNALPEDFAQKLRCHGLVSSTEVATWGERSKKLMHRLCELGVVHKIETVNNQVIYAYAKGEVSAEKFEALISPRVREAISEELWSEFKTKYSGKFRSIGTGEIRNDGVPTLRDRLRTRSVAEGAGVETSHVVQAMKYLEEHGLIKNEHNAYFLSARGERAGLGMRAIRFVQRAGKLESENSEEISLDKYLKAADRVRKTWKSPTYTMETKDGAAPWIYLIDEFLAGNARINTQILRQVIGDIQKSEQALIIASNMLQGDPSVEPRAMRTSVPSEATDGVDFRDYGNQLKLIKELFHLLGHPVLQMHGKNELATANIKADVQRERDSAVQEGMERPSEEMVKQAFSKLNDISYRAGRKYNAKLQAELLEFVANVVMPLELKLGRALMDSPEVKVKTGLNMNELEIVRDIASELIEDIERSSGEGRGRVMLRYSEFFALPEVGSEYLLKLEQALFPEKESLVGGDLIARGGASIQILTPNNEKGLRIVCLPEAKLGVAEAMNPTDKLISVIKSQTLAGKEIPDIVCVASTGQPFFSMTAGGTAIVSADTLQESSFEDRYSKTESLDRHKRRRWSRGGENFAGAIAFSGGIHDGIKTDAYTLRLWNPKIQDVLDANKAAGMPSRYVDIYATSDWQTGSPTSKPATWLRGLFWAIANGQKEIVINGDVFQGQNYGRAVAELQTTGIIGIGDQQRFVNTLLKPVLRAIKEMKDADPNFEIPKFKILAGNHETNSQSGKGAQGIWFLETLAFQIEAFYDGVFGEEISKTHVLYPTKFIDRMNVDVDYSHLVLDFTDEVGFRIAAQHYVGIGAKGSKSAPPISAAQTWARAMENEMRPVHGFLLGHWHTQSVTQADGVFCAIFGANADKSGFEWHLGYPTTVPASGRVRLYSDRPPELFFVTDPYLRLQEESLREIPQYKSLIDEHGSLEEFIEYERARQQKRDVQAFSYEELKFANGLHSFVDPQRKIAA